MKFGLKIETYIYFRLYGNCWHKVNGFVKKKKKIKCALTLHPESGNAIAYINLNKYY